MTKVVSALLLLIVGAAVIGAAAPTITKLAAALTVPLAIAGVLAVVLRVVWVVTRRW
jgi:hypothetical protein